MNRWLVSLVLVCALAGAAAAQTNVMFIFDASGSMKKKAGGDTRIAAAKRAMTAALEGMPGGVRLGLMMYGHRRAKDCTDIELVSPVGADDAGTIGATVQAVAPKGETPIAAALERAAKSFAAFKGQQNTIVLVTDGIEECRGDPCAAARALKAAGLDLKVHIVGYMLDAKQKRAIRCVTDETGGRFFDAGDPRSLTAALTEVRKVVEQTAPPPAPPAPEPVRVVATPEAPPPPKELPGVKLVALYAKGGKEYEGDVTFYVYDPKKDLDGKRRKVAEAYSVANGYIFRELPAGTYVLEARATNYIVREFPLEVKAGEAVRHELVMDMARVKFDAKLSEKDDYDGALTWKILDPKADLSGRRRQITDFYDKPNHSVLLVPSGEFALVVNPTEARYIVKERPLKVVAGEEQIVTQVLDAARVRLDAKCSAAGPDVTSDLVWRLLSPKKKLDGSRQQITDVYDVASGKVVLFPAGEWLMRVHVRGAKSVALEKPITVKAGEEQVYEAVLNSGFLEVQVTKDGQPYGDNVTWRAYGPGATPGEPEVEAAEHYNGRAKATKMIAAGTYRLEYGAARSGAPKASTKVTVEAGKTVALQAELPK